MINKKLKDIMETAKEVSFKAIKKGEDVLPCIFILGKDGKLTQLAIPFNNTQEKNMMKQVVKKFVANSELKGYVSVFDVKMTKFEKDMSNGQVVEAVLVTAYAPNDKLIIAYPYKNKKINEEDKMVMEGRDEETKMKDDWDFWGEGIDENDDFNKKYSEFRDDNPKLYGDD